MTFETYGLLGVGAVQNHFPSTLVQSPSTTGKIESKLIRYGILSAVGTRSRSVDLAVSTRITGLSYFDVSGDLVFAGEDQVEYLRRENTHLLVEPALTMRAGFVGLKLQMQLGHTYNLSHADFRQDHGHLTLGIGCYLAR